MVQNLGRYPGSFLKKGWQPYFTRSSHSPDAEGMQLDDRQRAFDVCIPTDGKLFAVPAAEEEGVDNPYRRLEGRADTSIPDGWDMERWKEGGTLAEAVDERRWRAFIVSTRVDL